MPPIVLFSEFRGDFILNLLHPVYAMLLGVCVGSFLNVCLLRWKSGEPIVFPASHCPSCLTVLHWYENIPLVSFFALRGKCSSCKSPISWQYPLVELSTGLLFLFCTLRFQAPLTIAGSCFFGVFLILLVVSDLKWRLLPHVFNNLLALTAFFFSFFKLFLQNGVGFVDPFQALTGYAFAGAFFMMINFLYPKGMGGGDGVMAAGLGAWLGSERVLIMILIAFGLGALVSLPMLLTGRLKRKSMIPFGPYLAFSSFVIWFFPHWADFFEGLFFPNS